MWNNDRQAIETLEKRMDMVEKHDLICDEKHRRLDDKIITMCADLSKIRENTEKTANGENAKEMLKKGVVQLAGLLVALSIIWEPIGKFMRYILSLS